MTKKQKIKDLVKWLLQNNLLDMAWKSIRHPNAVGQFLSGNAGWQWEDELKEMLDDKGIPWAPSPKLNERHELIVNGLTIQCKFTGHKTCAPISHCGHTMLYNVGDYDVLALKVFNPDRYFFIPAEELYHPTKPGKLKGSVSIKSIRRWQNAWWVLAQSPQPTF